MIPFRRLSATAERRFAGLVVVPGAGDCSTPEQLVESLDHSIAALRELKLRAPNPETQRKYDETRLFYVDVREKWNRISGLTCWVEKAQA